MIPIGLLLLPACLQPQGPPDVPRPERRPDAQVLGDLPDLSELASRASAAFGVLPSAPPSESGAEMAARVALGQMLYFEERLSRSQEVSCNTCHDLARHGVDGQATPVGPSGQRGPRNAPSVYNSSMLPALYWDGRADNLEAQALEALVHPAEMDLPDAQWAERILTSIPDYQAMFAAAFPGESGTPVTARNAARALAAFERTLVTPAPIDRFIGGDTGALTADQVAGLDAFLAAGCERCHSGPGIGGGQYIRLGAAPAAEAGDPGRFSVTGREEDRHAFRVPSLRNVAETGPWMHDGSATAIDDVLRNVEIHPLDRALDAEEARRIRAFLDALTGTLPANVTAPVRPDSGPDTPGPDDVPPRDAPAAAPPG